MNIGYAKLGRSLKLTPASWGIVGGDQEAVIVLNDLAKAHPEHNFILVGKNSGENPQEIGLPPNVFNPWIDLKPKIPICISLNSPEDIQYHTNRVHEKTKHMFTRLDTCIVWVGQHGTSNNSIPIVGKSWKDRDWFTKPQASTVHYAAYIIRGLNEMCDKTNGLIEPIFIITDSRNNIKCRDLKWPVQQPVLGLYNETLKTKHERWEDERSPNKLHIMNAEWVGDQDPGVWYADTSYVYSGVELATMIPSVLNFCPDLNSFNSRSHFGMIVNEARSYVEYDRKTILQDWIFPLKPAFIYGKWSNETLDEWGMNIAPVNHFESFSALNTTKVTFTTPSSGSGWATRKAWEAFQMGAVCLFHPNYDTQGHVLPTLEQVSNYSYPEHIRELAVWLRCTSKEDFWSKYYRIITDEGVWKYLAYAQHKYLQERIAQKQFLTALSNRFDSTEILLNELNSK